MMLTVVDANEEHVMSDLAGQRFLRRVLYLDAATCAVLGALLAVDSAMVGGLTALSPRIVHVAGISLLPIAAFLVLVASRPAIPPAGVAVILAGNLAWIAASIGLLGLDRAAPNGLGVACVLTQAAAVAGFAALEYRGWQKLRGTGRFAAEAQA